MDRNYANIETPIFSGDVRRVEHNKRSHKDADYKEQPEPDRMADQLIMQAEKFKARIEAPKGKISDMLMPYDYDKLRTNF